MSRLPRRSLPVTTKSPSKRRHSTPLSEVDRNGVRRTTVRARERGSGHGALVVGGGFGHDDHFVDRASCGRRRPRAQSAADAAALGAVLAGEDEADRARAGQRRAPRGLRDARVLCRGARRHRTIAGPRPSRGAATPWRATHAEGVAPVDSVAVPTDEPVPRTKPRRPTADTESGRSSATGPNSTGTTAASGEVAANGGTD